MMFKKILKISAVAVMSASSFLFVTEGEAASSLPNGASSLSESYKSWSLGCENVKGVNRCLVQQQVWNARPRQRLVVLSFQPEGMQLHGSVIVPFGVELAKGVTFLADGAPVGPVLPFSTCLPTGCVAPLDIDVATLKKIEDSQKVEVSISAINGKDMKFPLSPQGLSDAMKRAISLTK